MELKLDNVQLSTTISPTSKPSTDSLKVIVTVKEVALVGFKTPLVIPTVG